MDKITNEEIYSFFDNDLSEEKIILIKKYIEIDLNFRKRVRRLKKNLATIQAKTNMLPHSKAKVEMFVNY